MDIHLSEANDQLLVELVSEDALAWAEAFLDEHQVMRVSRNVIVIPLKYKDYMLHAAFDADMQLDTPTGSGKVQEHSCVK